jgi:hypothetical protein
VKTHIRTVLSRLKARTQKRELQAGAANFQ